MLGPKNFNNFKNEFSEDYKGVPNIRKELDYFAVNPFNRKQKLTIDLFIDFCIWDEDDSYTINKDDHKVTIKQKGGIYEVYEDGEFLVKFKKKLIIESKQYRIFRNIVSVNKIFKPPIFGFTILGRSHGFDSSGSTSGFIIWINRKGILIDPPPFSSQALRQQSIPSYLIQKLIVTHCHADHDAGTFHKIIEANRIELLSSETILNSFFKKYSAISQASQQELQNLVQFRTLRMGHPTYIFGARFTFHYSFHTIPTLCFEIDFKGKKFYFSGDTLYDPELLRNIYETQDIFSKERFEFLA